MAEEQAAPDTDQQGIWEEKSRVKESFDPFKVKISTLSADIIQCFEEVGGEMFLPKKLDAMYEALNFVADSAFDEQWKALDKAFGQWSAALDDKRDPTMAELRARKRALFGLMQRVGLGIRTAKVSDMGGMKF